MREINVFVSESDLAFLDELVRAGLEPNRSEAIRHAIKDLRELHTGK